MTALPDVDGPASLSGVIIETATGLCFVHAENALVAVDNPRLSPLPGTELELLWFEGHVVPAAALSLLAPELTTPKAPAHGRKGGLARKSAEKSALVCELAGQRLALTGVELLVSGRFEVIGDAETVAREMQPLRVRYRDEVVERVDLGALFAAAVALAEGPGVPTPHDLGPEETRDEDSNPGDSERSRTARDDTK